MKNTQSDAPEQRSGLLPSSKWDYPERDVFMWFAFLCLSPAKRFIRQHNMPLLFLISEVSTLIRSAQERLMLPVPAREMLKVYTLYD